MALFEDHVLIYDIFGRLGIRNAFFPKRKDRIKRKFEKKLVSRTLIKIAE